MSGNSTFILSEANCNSQIYIYDCHVHYCDSSFFPLLAARMQNSTGIRDALALHMLAFHMTKALNICISSTQNT